MQQGLAQPGGHEQRLHQQHTALPRLDQQVAMEQRIQLPCARQAQARTNIIIVAALHGPECPFRHSV
jgi:hypothetical protein